VILITTADLKTQSKSQLGRLAKGLGVSDWQSMRKEDLVALLMKKNKASAAKPVAKKPVPASADKKAALVSKKSAPKKTETKLELKLTGKSTNHSTVAPKNGSKKVVVRQDKDADKKLNDKSYPVKNGSKAAATKGSLPKVAGKGPVAKTTVSKVSAPPTSSSKANGIKSASDKKVAVKAQESEKGSSAKLAPGKKIVAPAKVAPSSKDATSKTPTDKKVQQKTAVVKSTESPSAKSTSKPVNKPAAAKAPEVSAKRVGLAVPKTPSKQKTVPKKPVSSTDAKILEHLRKLQEQRDLQKDLAQPALKLADPNAVVEKLPAKTGEKDRIVLIVRDPFWLQASWDVSRRAIERARASMAEHWHTAKPILRLLTIGGTGSTNAAETVDRDIEIHGGVRNWYIEVKQPPGSFRVLLGYLAANNRFHELSRSNIVNSPAPGSSDAVDGNWADIAQDCEHIYALSGGYNVEHESKELQEMFEDRLKRPMGTPALTQFGSGAETSLKRKKEFQFDIDAEMILYGVTQIDAYVTLGGEPVKIREDGSFSVRMPLPDRRQVLPAVASSRDGTEQRTIVIAVERNTKVMEPLSKETEE
jgi:hypothetical protein